MNRTGTFKNGFFRKLAIGVVGMLGLWATAAFAHDELLSYARTWAEPDAWVIEVVLDPYVTESLFSGKTEDPYYQLDPNRLEPIRAMLCEEAKTFFKVETGGRALDPLNADFRIELDDCIYSIRYPRMGDGELTLSHRFFDRLREGHRTILDVIMPDGSVAESIILSARDPGRTISLIDTSPVASVQGAGADEQGNAVCAPSRDWFPLIFFKLGLEHIAFGFDHLLFLGGLLVACRRPSDILAIVTSFTLAHSITLSVAALNWWVPPSKIVEPAIAASIVYVGVENILRSKIGKGRALLTFAFGLIHGFGFAGVLRDLGLGQDGRSIVSPLFAFNVGIEAGQLTIVALVLPGLLWLQHASPHLRRWLKPGLSLIIALIGLYWLLQRTVFSAL